MAKTIKFNVEFNIDGKTVLAACTADARELAKQLGQVQTAAQKASTFFEKFGKVKDQFDKTAQALDDLTAESNQFAAAMREANTMAGKSGADFDTLKDKVNGLSREIPVARDLLAKGLYQVVSNGVPENNWISYLQASAKASVGGLANLEEVVKVTSTVIKNYGLDWSEAQSIQDKIQLTAKNGVTSFEQLAQALPRVTGNAATLGISIDELMASFATLTGVSGNTAEVSTQLAAVMTALVKPSSEAANMAKEMGIQFDAAAVKSAGGLNDFLQQVDQAVQTYSQKTGQTAQTIYGKLFGSAEALRALIPLTGELKDKVTENLGAMNNSSGTMAEAFDTMSGSVGATVQKLKNYFGTFTDAVATAYNAVKPITSGLGIALGAMADIGVVTQSVLALNTALKPLGGLVQVATKQLSLWIGQAKASAAVNWLLHGSAKGVAAGTAAAAAGINVMKVAMRGFIAATGVGIVLTILGEIVGMLIEKFGQWREETKKTAAALTDEERAARSAQQVHQALAEAQADGAKRAADETVKIKTLADTVHNANASYQARRNAIAELQKIVPSYHASLTSEGKLIENNAGSVQKYCNALKQKAVYEAAQDKLKALAGQKMEASQAQGAWRGAVNIRQKRYNDAQKRYNDTLASYARTGVAIDPAALADLASAVTKAANQLDAAKQKVLDYGDSWNAATRAEEQLAKAAQEAYDSMSKLMKVDTGSTGGGTKSGGTKSGGAASVPKTDYSALEALNQSMKPIDGVAALKFTVDEQNLRDQIALISRALENAAGGPLPLTVNARTQLADRRDDLQRQLDQLTGNTGGGASSPLRLTVEAVPDLPSAAYGSTEDKYQSRQNAQSRAQRLTEYVDLGIIGKDEAQRELDEINARLQSIGMKPVRLDIEVNTDRALTKMEKFSASIDKMSGAWSAITSVSSGIESLTETLEGSGTVWEKVQAVMNTAFSTFSNISQLLQQFTPLTKAATAATQASTAATQAQAAANSAEGMSAAGAAMGHAAASGAKLPFPANIAAIAAGVAAVVTVITTMAACFETGGIVGGASFTGDRVPVRVNSGEMILNRRQQATLFKLANGQARPLSAPAVRLQRGADLSAPRLSDLAALAAAIQPQQVEVTVSGKIRGRDIHLANDRRSRLLSKC